MDAKQVALDMKRRAKQLQKVHAVQANNGNWNSDRYMRGMYNGLELALAIMEDREPSYRDSPADGYLHEEDSPEFTKALSALLNRTSWDAAVGMSDFLLAEMLTHILQGMEVAHDRQRELSPVQDTVAVTDGAGNVVAEYPAESEEESKK